MCCSFFYHFQKNSISISGGSFVYGSRLLVRSGGLGLSFLGERSSNLGYPSWGSVPVTWVILLGGAFRLVRSLGTRLRYAPFFFLWRGRVTAGAHCLFYYVKTIDVQLSWTSSLGNAKGSSLCKVSFTMLMKRNYFLKKIMLKMLKNKGF